MKAEIIAIGSELVGGQRVDTNSAWISSRLGELGIPVRFHTSISDDLAENVSVLRIALDRAELVVTTGGLGPTQDDLTRETVAAVAGVKLVEDEASLRHIKAMFLKRRREMAERNKVQALFPAGSEPLPNRVGTAPGIGMDLGRAWVACLPGVPSEMKVMFDEQVAPRLRARGLAGRSIVHRSIHLFGLGESEVEARAMDLTARGRTPEVGITASDATITLRVSAEGADEAEALDRAEPTLAAIRGRFGEVIVGENGEGVADALVKELAAAGATIAVAESCTGGLVAAGITAIPGVSARFLGGVVAYANAAKTAMIDVPAALIEAHGAVSGEVAEAMAAGVRDRFGSSLGLSITGVAGPGGGTPGKPVGLVYLGLADESGEWHRRLDLGPEQPREVIRGRSAKHAMNWARLHLRGRRIGSGS